MEKPDTTGNEREHEPIKCTSILIGVCVCVVCVHKCAYVHEYVQ